MVGKIPIVQMSAELDCIANSSQLGGPLYNLEAVLGPISPGT